MIMLKLAPIAEKYRNAGICAMVGCGLLILAASVAPLVIGVLELMYLYRTANAFRQYACC